MTAPCSGQAKFSENVSRLLTFSEVSGDEGKISTIAIPSARFKQVAKESVNLSWISFFRIKRSTTISISWTLFFSSSILSLSSRTSPSIRTRANPSAASPANNFLWVPFLPRITGASNWKRVRSLNSIIASTIRSMVWGAILRSQIGQWGAPARPNNNRK